MNETQALTIALATVPTFAAVLIGLLLNNHRLNDVRDLLRAEIQKSHSELLVKFAELDSRIERIEQRLQMS